MNHSLSRKFRHIALFSCLVIGLSACSSIPNFNSPAEPAQTDLRFVDLQKFDRELYSSLSQSLPSVEVAFYNEVTPNALPERLQNWMAAVETGGGKVKVIPPKSSVQPKDPFLLLSLATTLWSASKTAKELSTNSRFNSAVGYDAVIQLKIDEKGTSVVEKVVFNKKPASAK